MPGGFATGGALAPRNGHSAKPPVRAALVFKAAWLIAATNVVCSIYPDFAVVHTKITDDGFIVNVVL